MCNGGPKCRRDHRLKQDPRWTVDQLPDGDVPLDHPDRAAVHDRTNAIPDSEST